MTVSPGSILLHFAGEGRNDMSQFARVSRYPGSECRASLVVVCQIMKLQLLNIFAHMSLITPTYKSGSSQMSEVELFGGFPIKTLAFYVVPNR